ncbi:MAG: NAD(P) transhydrogenase subunit alpha [Clostridiaceae bacterium]|jgi:NAD(P) transhydrogenase subunit alpha|nr:NAD(P) transhydrogenase subunit alpha [Clostridiaceae bacterium]
MNPLFALALFLLSTAAGYLLIRQVPALLHTPLMSGTNALSGLAVLGALSLAGVAAASGNRWLGLAAIVLGMVNVVGGFGVTERMLRLFKKRDRAGDPHA